MALGLPQSDFVGVDLAEHAISQACATAKALNLPNISFHRLDVMQIAADFGQFDYIVAHGLYSWVPPETRDKVLAVCRANLAAHGVAYVSYNTYPGCHLRDMVRGMMSFHAQRFDEPEKQIQQARALIKFLVDSKIEPDPYRLFLQQELERVGSCHDSVIYHDYLEATNFPVYFVEFIEHAARHGLQYLAEADFFEMHDHTYAPHIREALRALAGDRILKEQYLDFLKCRRFRQTLLCHANVPLDCAARPERLRSLLVSSLARPASESPDVTSRAVEQFRGTKGGAVSTDLPLAKAALCNLSRAWPAAVPFGELLAQARAQIGTSSLAATDIEADAQLLCDVLFQLYAAGLIELRVHVPHFVLEPAERPTVSPLARLQAMTSERLTNLFHKTVEVADPEVRHLVHLMDGTRDHFALRSALAEALRSRAAGSEDPSQTAAAVGESDERIGPALQEILGRLARCGLLTA